MLPIEVSGTWHLLLATDNDDTVTEVAGESNNVVHVSTEITLAPLPNLVVSDVTFTSDEILADLEPPTIIDDPAQVTVGWTVTNQGTGPGFTDTWFDQVIASVNDTVGDTDDIVVATFEHTGFLPVGDTYQNEKTFLLPPEFQGRYHWFVKTDATELVFENDQEPDNLASAAGVVDVMPIPYADLVVSSVQTTATASSGQPLEVTWEVTNQGIGITSEARWFDWIQLARNPDGSDVVAVLDRFNHIGSLAPDAGYPRTGIVTLPEGLVGTFYVVVDTAPSSSAVVTQNRVFEFLFKDNNRSVSAAIEVALTPPPDLIIKAATEENGGIIAPTTATEGEFIDITWTVQNAGEGDAAGSWRDEVYLRPVGDADGQQIDLGEFKYTGRLQAGGEYSRTEQFRLPGEFEGAYEVVVHTNVDDFLFELGEGRSNNATVRDEVMTVIRRPRPDLQVHSISTPAPEVAPGATFSVDFTIINQGEVPTTTPMWVDRVYLSLDTSVSQDDLLIDTIENQSALGTQASDNTYSSQSATVEVPRRFRGPAHIIVVADAKDGVDEWPNEDNVGTHEIFITKVPLADLVTGEVVGPAQAVEGAEFEVRYTVTNRGAGPTDADHWTDSIWLTDDKNRPHPGQGDILLTKIPQDRGFLETGEGYDQSVTVKLPDKVPSRIYYITPWSDIYDEVLEDTLANNVNQDDAGEMDNNNYKARRIDVVGLPGQILLPDLEIKTLTVDEEAFGGDEFTFTYEVANIGQGEVSGPWEDDVYLSDVPDPLAQARIRGSSVGSGERRFSTSHTQKPWYSHLPSRATDSPYLSTEQAASPNPTKRITASRQTHRFKSTGQISWLPRLYPSRRSFQASEQPSNGRLRTWATRRSGRARGIGKMMSMSHPIRS